MTSATTNSSSHPQQRPQGGSRGWRVIDIVIAAVLAVACGLIFWVWNSIGYAWFSVMDAATPGLGGLASGIWFIGGVIGGLVIRKPGAALFVELVAAIVSAAIGNQWGIETLYSGIAQGLGAEIAVALFAYRRFSLSVSLLMGLLSGVGAFLLELVTSANYAKSFGFNVTYLVCTAISGAILAGLVGYLLVKALAATGALDRFAVGREARTRV